MPTINSINNATPNSFTVQNTNANTPVSYTIQETSNSANSTAYKLISTAGSSAGNPFVRWQCGAASSFSLGVVNGATPYVSLNYATSGAVPGVTNQFMIGTTSGALTFPKQPAFFAYRYTSNLTDITGDGTDYQIIFNTTIIDNASAFNTATGVFTAPATGKYHFRYNCVLNTFTGATNVYKLHITTTQHEFTGEYSNWKAATGSLSADGAGAGSSVIAQMTTGDTAYVRIQSGGGTKIQDIIANKLGLTFFSGSHLG